MFRLRVYEYLQIYFPKGFSENLVPIHDYMSVLFNFPLWNLVVQSTIYPTLHVIRFYTSYSKFHFHQHWICLRPDPGGLIGGKVDCIFSQLFLCCVCYCCRSIESTVRFFSFRQIFSSRQDIVLISDQTKHRVFWDPNYGANYFAVSLKSSISSLSTCLGLSETWWISKKRERNSDLFYNEPNPHHFFWLSDQPFDIRTHSCPKWRLVFWPSYKLHVPMGKFVRLCLAFAEITKTWYE